jgi:hypothetical protein
MSRISEGLGAVEGGGIEVVGGGIEVVGGGVGGGVQSDQESVEECGESGRAIVADIALDVDVDVGADVDVCRKTDEDEDDEEEEEEVGVFRADELLAEAVALAAGATLFAFDFFPSSPVCAA